MLRIKTESIRRQIITSTLKLWICLEQYISIEKNAVNYIADLSEHRCFFRTVCVLRRTNLEESVRWKETQSATVNICFFQRACYNWRVRERNNIKLYKWFHNNWEICVSLCFSWWVLFCFSGGIFFFYLFVCLWSRFCFY